MASFRSVLQTDGKTPHDGKDRVTQSVTRVKKNQLYNACAVF